MGAEIARNPIIFVYTQF